MEIHERTRTYDAPIMVAVLEYILIPAGLLLVVGLGSWSYRRHGAVFALDDRSKAYPIAAVALVVGTIAQILVPMEHKSITQPLLIVGYLLLFGALVAAGLIQRCTRAHPSEPRA